MHGLPLLAGQMLGFSRRPLFHGDVVKCARNECGTEAACRHTWCRRLCLYGQRDKREGGQLPELRKHALLPASR